MANVQFINVNKIYPGGLQAIYDMNLEIRDREFMVLVGPSGCGKSTALRMVAGLEVISKGAIEINGREVNDLPPKDRDIAMVFQNYALYPHMSVFDNMAFGLKLRGVPKAEIKAAVEDAAKTLGIHDLLLRRPKALSGGQRQRVALGRAIVRKPAVFLLDEPLSNLDAKMRLTMRKELNLLHQRLQATLIYVTHDQVEAMTLGERICVMNAGRVQQVGKPLDIYDHPANKFVAGFIGTPPMNFFDGELTKDGEQSFFRSAGMNLKLEGPLAQAAVSASGQKVTFGVRPENIVLGNGESNGEGLRARVEVVEKLGDQQLIYLTVEDKSFVAKTDAHQEVHDGETRVVKIDYRRAHLFGGEEGRSLGT